MLQSSSGLVTVDKIRFFVDEAGDPTIFNNAGEVIIGNNGCSRFFMLGKLEVDDPNLLAHATHSFAQQTTKLIPTLLEPNPFALNGRRLPCFSMLKMTCPKCAFKSSIISIH